MWIMVLYDLPTLTREQRKKHAEFRKDLIKCGFLQHQFSVYFRWCGSVEMVETQIRRVEKIMPDEGKVTILTLTDKQYGMMRLYTGRSVKIKRRKTMPGQLAMFHPLRPSV
ncbi:MAG: CRISPR-associated endonuclease Cas2 [Bacteroidia bacterium]|nr:CRISPR-associated endonuclease Cas2 [Bacteroidia bacterium]MDW8333010.1 CRISPR-associated endonuclease Cas2 [Bacteroidia bacterium]